MTKPVRIGLIGYGLFGAHHAAAIARTPGAELRAIAVPSEKSRQAASAAHPGAAIHVEAGELLARDDIDAVVVVVPNRLHAEIGLAVLESGRHLLLEKPMALELEDCRRLLAAAERKSLTLAIGHELRCSSLWGGVKDLIDQGAIGEPQAVLVELSRFPYRQGSDGWRYDAARVGNWVLEEPIHFFDLARWYLTSAGEPTSIRAWANSRDPSRPELRDHFAAVMSYANGSYGMIVQTLSAFGHHQTAKVSGMKGTIWATWGAADARSPRPTFQLRYGLGDQVSDATPTKPAGELLELADEIAAFVRSIRESVPPPCTGRDGYWSTRLCLAAAQSIVEGRDVDLIE